MRSCLLSGPSLCPFTRYTPFHGYLLTFSSVANSTVISGAIFLFPPARLVERILLALAVTVRGFKALAVLGLVWSLTTREEPIWGIYTVLHPAK